ncbi:iron-sulfur cluster repair di-iron protein [Alkaliphilus peptidifermentans]|uniref:Regulator of cell morphogenesis and NO signaling n=1 Tax=Alkaliphilus peptidifermentans DSM 18978 TaxID=1120976 RepID=A0A1G5J2Y5_9FIRM|nr:iron-sulfur cluster repair di-iron protein [Alkaliphilus peptidifermentans]SCY82331.1 regulator of cell morphogenesis and NO signaling [Alkaliphilus peptidifermentans DSM 18978]
MENVFTSTHKIGDIVTKLPRAAEIFKAQGIDFCCGGDRPLSVAILEQNLNEDIILAQLNQAYAEAKELKDKGIDWENAGYSQLIDYIIDKHHTYVRKELPRLSDLTAKILKVHWVDNGEVLTKVHKDFHMLKMELEQHLIKEEEILFPMVKDYEKNPSRELLEKILQVNKELEDEHDGAGDLLKSLRKITTNFTVPAGGCNSYILTFKGLEELEWDLFQHIHLENNVLFKRLEEELE